MRLAKKWHKQVFAAVLGAAVVGAPLFAVHAGEPTFSPDGERYDVRRGMYEKEGGSDEHVRLGKYADEKHQEARDEERREELAKRQAEEREDLAKRQAEERKELEDRQTEERGEKRAEETKEVTKETHSENRGEQREYRYDVRRGMYEKEGGSDTEVRRGMYEDTSRPESERSSLTR